MPSLVRQALTRVTTAGGQAIFLASASATPGCSQRYSAQYEQVRGSASVRVSAAINEARGWVVMQSCAASAMDGESSIERMASISAKSAGGSERERAKFSFFV